MAAKIARERKLEHKPNEPEQIKLFRRWQKMLLLFFVGHYPPFCKQKEKNNCVLIAKMNFKISFFFSYLNSSFFFLLFFSFKKKTILFFFYQMSFIKFSTKENKKVD